MTHAKSPSRGFFSGLPFLERLLLEVFSDGLARGSDGFHRSFQLYFGALEGLDPQLHLIGVVDVDALGVKGMG